VPRCASCARAGAAAGSISCFASGEVVALGGGGPAEGVVHIHHDRTFARLVLRGELGVGEAFVAGDWSSPDLVAAARVFLRGSGARGVESPLTWLANLSTRRRHRRDQNTRAGSARNIHAHYDLGNAFYQLMLDDQTLAYSAALWDQPGLTLAGAQQAQVRAPVRAARAGPGRSPARDRLRLGRHGDPRRAHARLPRHGGHRVAPAAAAGAAAGGRGRARRPRDAGVLRLPRSRRPAYDKVVSVEMIEAVGHEHLPGFFQACARALRPAGRMALQAITMPDERYETYRRNVDWMQTYIFPGSLIPSLGGAAPGLGRRRPGVAGRARPRAGLRADAGEPGASASSRRCPRCARSASTSRSSARGCCT
jgi:cyclopropane-fatty-acyl-phospholipid synthase